tara:strand:+ start:276 stop:572 length:297 start_codon:yes stop_codon:yes gene_type:complete
MSLPKCIVLKKNGSIVTSYFNFSRSVDLTDIKSLLKCNDMSTVPVSKTETMYVPKHEVYVREELNKSAMNFLKRNNIPGVLIFGDAIVMSDRFLKLND